MRECLNEEILQQYFDGELVGKRMESAALHLAGCEACAASLQKLEAEANLVSSALAPEFGVAVPTERLHRRIEAAIAGLQVVSPVSSRASTSGWHSWIEALSAMFSLSPQRAFGYAGLAVVLVFGAILGISRWRSTQPSSLGTQSAATKPVPTAPPVAVSSPTTQIETVVATGNGRGPIGQRNRKTNQIQRPRVPDTSQAVAEVKPVAEVKLLPGERTYLKTIAALDTTIKSGNKSMRPALQAEYERNLALVDRAIAATRSAAKRNPNDPDAAEFMFSAYQSKVDLLNTIADARVYNRPR